MSKKVAPRLNRGWPTIVIVNHSDNVTQKRLRQVVAALQKQVDRDFFPVWGWKAKLRIRAKVTPGLMSITLRNRDRSGSGDAGYHVDGDGIPSALVFTHGNGGDEQDLFATLSHEVLEMIADPALNLYASAYRTIRKRRHRIFVGVEVCDPVQYCSYEIDGIRVSDFVVPEWFESARPAGSMKFSFKGNVDAPLEVAKDGYKDVILMGRLPRVEQVGGEQGRVRHRMTERERVLHATRRGKPEAKARPRA